MVQARLSLKARAMVWLAQREHSRAELRRKLLRVVHLQQQESAKSGRSDEAVLSDTSACNNPPRCVDRLLDWLAEHGYLSDARFVESRVHARSARYGNLRISQELAQHGVQADADTQVQLRDSELERARQVWERKFAGVPAEDVFGRSRQMRFLAQRGFSPDVIRRVVRGRDPDA